MKMPSAAVPLRPIIGNKTFEGKFQMLKFYFNGSPNPTKVALVLEEAGFAYEPVAVDTRKGDQFSRNISPSIRTPRCPPSTTAASRCSTATPSCSISPRRPASFCRRIRRPTAPQLLSWLMFVATGVGPFSGQAVHFKHFAPEKVDYAHNRYQFEAQRHYTILNDHLAKRRYMVGDTYTIVDMDVWGWAAHDPVRPRRGGRREISQRQTAWSTRSRPVRRRRRRSPSRMASSSRRRWTTRRAATCSSTSP